MKLTEEQKKRLLRRVRREKVIVRLEKVDWTQLSLDELLAVERVLKASELLYE